MGWKLAQLSVSWGDLVFDAAGIFWEGLDKICLICLYGFGFHGGRMLFGVRQKRKKHKERSMKKHLVLGLLAGLLAVAQAVNATTTSVSQSGRALVSGAASSPQGTVAGGGGGSAQPCPKDFSRVVIDGCFADWAAVPTLVTDAKGDFHPAGADVLSLKVANDGEYGYFLYEFAAPPSQHVFLLINVDGNRRSGCLTGIGFEAGVTINPLKPGNTDESYIGDGRDCSWGGDDYPGALNFAVGGNFVEISVPRKVLNTIAGRVVEKIEVTCGNDQCGRVPAPYTMKEDPLVGNIKGMLPLVAVCWNLSTGEYVFAPNGATEWDCRKLGLDAEDGDLVVIGAVGIVGGVGVLPGGLDDLALQR